MVCSHISDVRIPPRKIAWGMVVLAAVLAVFPRTSQAGGGPENVLLIVDPNDANSLYVANYYKTARGIPDRNIIYMDPEASNYDAFVGFQLDAFLGTLTTRAIDDHIDYVIIPPGPNYRISASGFISDSCSSVSRFSIASIYTLAHIVDEILDGDTSQNRNEYFGFSNLARAFDSNTLWLSGSPSSSSSARRYFIGAMLGYNGERGNTIEETLDMIDRSVLADGTHPAGTFYYVETTDVNRSGPRDNFFDAAVAAIISNGGSAEHLGDGVQNIVLPEGEHDCLGIMTGVASPDILGADLTILGGAFCDHLTSFAGFFGTSSQTKMSDWITKGASGTCGTVEEPCNYPGKFPHPRMHVYYQQGLSLGESNLRSLGFAPYQSLMYGDPLTRPFAFIPTVDVPDAPVGDVSGIVILTPTATTDLPGGSMSHFDLHVDGVLFDTTPDGGTLSIDTNLLGDGPHDMRVIAFEDSVVATQGTWIGVLDVNNAGRTATATTVLATGDLTTVFLIDVSAAGGDVTEIRLMHNTRIVAATQTAADSFFIAADALGAGVVQLVAVADFEDGRRAVSQPLELDIAFAGFPPDGGGNSAPVAHSYSTHVAPGVPVLLDLPATDAEGDDLTMIDVTQPAQGAVASGGGTFLLTPDENAEGTDTVTFRASDGALTSEVATVTINYCGVPEIIGHPENQEACLGQTATFEVSVVGDELTYQWLFEDQPIPDAIGETLFLEDVQESDAGLYSVDVTSTCGVIRTTVHSDNAFLNVTEPVVFTVQPQGETLCVGDTWFMFISAPEATSLQWLLDGQPIPGAVAAFYIITDAGPADRGTYTVEGSNGCGPVLSDPAVVEVNGCGDGDADGDVDLADFGGLQECFTGPGGGDLPGDCPHYDFDGDNDIDLDDYEAYLDAVTAP